MKKSSALRWMFPVAGLFAAAAGAYVVSMPKEAKPRVLISCGNLTGMLLSELAINPTTLATVGAEANQVSAIVSAARGLCEGEGGSFGQAHVACENAQQRLHALEVRASHGGLRDNERQQLEDARAEVEDLRAARNELIAQVEQVVIATLNAEQEAAWRNIRAAKGIEVDAPYKVIARDEMAWVALRDRIAEERTIALAGGNGGGNPAPHNPQSPDAPDLVEPEVQVAQAALENNLPTVEDAWRAAMVE